MAGVLRNESDTDHRYRLTRTNRGYLLSCAQKSKVGLVLGPSEWPYRTLEAAEKGFVLIKLMNVWWTAVSRGYRAGDLPAQRASASAEHTREVERLNDQPFIGREVRELREQVERNAR